MEPSLDDRRSRFGDVRVARILGRSGHGKMSAPHIESTYALGTKRLVLSSCLWIDTAQAVIASDGETIQTELRREP